MRNIKNYLKEAKGESILAKSLKLYPNKLTNDDLLEIKQMINDNKDLMIKTIGDKAVTYYSSLS